MGMGFHHGGPNTSSDDIVKILIDPFQDKRHAYLFYVNPSAPAAKDWLMEVIRASLGWHLGSQEPGAGEWLERRAAHPLQDDLVQARAHGMGINVERIVPRKLETIRLSGTNRDSNSITRWKPPPSPESRASVREKDHVQALRPGQLRRDGGLDRRTDNSLDGGFDIYKNFTPTSSVSSATTWISPRPRSMSGEST